MYVQELTFEKFPPVPPETITNCWASCTKVIDSSSRQLIRKMKKKNAKDLMDKKQTYYYVTRITTTCIVHVWGDFVSKLVFVLYL